MYFIVISNHSVLFSTIVPCYDICIILISTKQLNCNLSSKFVLKASFKITTTKLPCFFKKYLESSLFNDFLIHIGNIVKGILKCKDLRLETKCKLFKMHSFSLKKLLFRERKTRKRLHAIRILCFYTGSHRIDSNSVTSTC